MKRYSEIIADNLSKSGWSWGCVASVNRDGRTIFVADAHRDDGKRFVVHADEKLTAFMELESANRQRTPKMNHDQNKTIPKASTTTGPRKKSIWRLIIGALLIGAVANSLSKHTWGHDRIEVGVFLVLNLLLAAYGASLVVGYLRSGREPQGRRTDERVNTK
jgi:hypothetical protein